MASSQNIVGPIVRRIRYQKGWTQAMLTARCARVGWDVGENTIAKIEARIRCVTDDELVHLARALEVNIQDLFPAEKLKKRGN
jgi:transcriptional regulator with XRE-family HTH domain